MQQSMADGFQGGWQQVGYNQQEIRICASTFTANRKESGEVSFGTAWNPNTRMPRKHYAPPDTLPAAFLEPLLSPEKPSIGAQNMVIQYSGHTIFD